MVEMDITGHCKLRGLDALGGGIEGVEIDCAWNWGVGGGV